MFLIDFMIIGKMLKIYSRNISFINYKFKNIIINK